MVEAYPYETRPREEVATAPVRPPIERTPVLVIDGETPPTTVNDEHDTPLEHDAEEVPIESTPPVPFPYRSCPDESVVEPVPPFATVNVPPNVRVPEFVIGPPVKVSPVVPPEPETDVTYGKDVEEL